MSLLASSSYSIYLIHGPALVIMLALCSRWHLLDSTNKDVVLLACAVLAVSAGILCHFFAEKPLQKWLPLPRPAVNASQS